MLRPYVVVVPISSNNNEKKRPRGDLPPPAQKEWVGIKLLHNTVADWRKEKRENPIPFAYWPLPLHIPKVCSKFFSSTKKSHR